jgi:hypothetical protein
VEHGLCLPGKGRYIGGCHFGGNMERKRSKLKIKIKKEMEKRKLIMIAMVKI